MIILILITRYTLLTSNYERHSLATMEPLYFKMSYNEKFLELIRKLKHIDTKYIISLEFGIK
jgi:hypothetical protein